MDVTRIYFTIYQLLVNFLLPGILMVACYSGSSIIGKSAFLSDPGIPGVRSMGPVVSNKLSEEPCCKLN